MHLHLVVPELFWPADDPRGAHQGLDLPAIETLIARGRKAVHPCQSVEDFLLQAFGIDTGTDVPSAPYAALADGLTPGDSVWWHAEPVHLKLGRDDFTLVDAADQIRLTSDEAAALVATLNAHFATDGIVFHAPHPDRWYLRMPPSAGECVTVPVARVRGRMVNPHLPRGTGARALRQVLNEAQMLLHEHPVNGRREGAGALPLNSIWPWGGGMLVPPPHIRMTSVHAALAAGRGLGLAAGITTAELPEDLPQVLASLPPTAVACVVLDDMRVHSAFSDTEAWRAGLARMESAWFAPALAALRTRRIGMITLHAPGPDSELRVETTASDLRFLWRRRRPLASYVRSPDERATGGAAA